MNAERINVLITDAKIIEGSTIQEIETTE